MPHVNGGCLQQALGGPSDHCRLTRFASGMRIPSGIYILVPLVMTVAVSAYGISSLHS